MGKIKRKAAHGLQDVAKKVVECSVGKSFMLLGYDPDIPGEVVKWCKEEKERKEN